MTGLRKMLKCNYNILTFCVVTMLSCVFVVRRFCKQDVNQKCCIGNQYNWTMASVKCSLFLIMSITAHKTLFHKSKQLSHQRLYSQPTLEAYSTHTHADNLISHSCERITVRFGMHMSHSHSNSTQISSKR